MEKPHGYPHGFKQIHGFRVFSLCEGTETVA
jgi:hypothetical protein